MIVKLLVLLAVIFVLAFSRVSLPLPFIQNNQLISNNDYLINFN